MSFSLNRKKSDKVRQYYVHDYEITTENDIVPIEEQQNLWNNKTWASSC